MIETISRPIEVENGRRIGEICERARETPAVAADRKRRRRLPLLTLSGRVKPFPLRRDPSLLAAT